VDLDFRPGITPTWASGWDIDDHACELHGVIVSDNPPMLETEELVVVTARRSGLPGGGRVIRGHGKATVVTGQETSQDEIRVGKRSGAGEPQLTGQPVLEGAPEPLDAAFGLGRSSQEELDAELLEQPSKLSRPLSAGELLVKARFSVGRAEEDPMAIGIDGERNAFSLDRLAHQLEIPLGVFLLAKQGPGHLTRRVVDPAHQAEPGTAALEPVVATGINLQQHPFPREPIPAPK